MLKEITRTYTLLVKDPRLLELAQECSQVYNLSMKTFWEYLDNDILLSAYKLQEKVYDKFKELKLHSDTKIAIIQQFRTAAKSYFEAKKEYEKHPKKFTGEPKPPKKEKSLFSIIFKEKAINIKKGKLKLSLKQGNMPISIPWDIKLMKPIWAVIKWYRNSGWQLSLTFKTFIEEKFLEQNNLMSVDLGIKRVATTFDGEKVVLYSGKELKSLVNLRNKVNSETTKKLSKLKKHSRRYKKIKRANRKVSYRIENKVKDICHKTSRTIVNYAIEHNIGSIVIGDCAGIHDSPNLGKVNNQAISQGCEQKVKGYIEYKFEAIGGSVRSIPEPYTSKTCPICGKLNEPNNRDYRCSGCGFEYDRDGVGSLNIWNLERGNLGKKVSFGEYLNVVGGLTPPIGWKYNSNRDCLVLSGH